MATVAAVGASAATIAAAGVQASQSSGKGGGGGGPAGPAPAGLRERLFNRGTAQIMNEERAILEQAILEGNLVSDEMYRALGLEPVYDRDAPDIAGMSSRLEALQGRSAEIQSMISNIRATPAGKGRELRQRRQDVRALRRERQNLDRQIALAREELGRASTVPRRIVAFKRLDGVADPTGSAGGAFGSALDQYNEGLSRALTGKEPLDPTMMRTFDERERVLRERLRRQLGPDYETSTAGAEALANFDREKTEAFALYNRESISLYDKLATGRAASLAELTSAKMKNLAFTPSFKATLGQTFEGLTQNRNQFRQLSIQERLGTAAAETAAYDAETRRMAATGAGGGGSNLQAILSGVGSAGGSLSKYLGEHGFGSPSQAFGTIRGALSGTGASLRNAGVAGAALRVD